MFSYKRDSNRWNDSLLHQGLKQILVLLVSSVDQQFGKLVCVLKTTSFLFWLKFIYVGELGDDDG
jgi:hypothetical protein